MKFFLLFILVCCLFFSSCKGLKSVPTSTEVHIKDSTIVTHTMFVDTIYLPAQKISAEIPLDVLQKLGKFNFGNQKGFHTKVEYKDSVIYVESNIDSLLNLRFRELIDRSNFSNTITKVVQEPIKQKGSGIVPELVIVLIMLIVILLIIYKIKK